MKTKIFIQILLALADLMSIIVITTGFGTGKKTWTYELKEVTAASSDPEKLNITLNIERVSRGIYAISGEVLLGFDIIEGDSNNIQAKSFRSTQGDSNYKVLPFQMPNTHFFKVINTHYKDVLMSTMKECSDMPVFEDKFQPPLEKKLYKLDACQFSQDGLPNHLQEGFYKLLILGTGDVEWQVNVVAEVIPDL